MNEIRQLLKDLQTPAVNNAAQERARLRALAAFQTCKKEPTAWYFPWRLTTAAAVALLIVIFWLGEDETDRANRTLLAQIEQLFPGQLNGVVRVDGNIDVVLEPTAPSITQAPSQPLRLTLRRGKQTVEALGYSGRPLRLDLDGHMRTLEPLVTGDGKVIVAGDNFLWTKKHPVAIAGYTLQAQPLAL